MHYIIELNINHRKCLLKSINFLKFTVCFLKSKHRLEADPWNLLFQLDRFVLVFPAQRHRFVVGRKLLSKWRWIMSSVGYSIALEGVHFQLDQDRVGCVQNRKRVPMIQTQRTKRERARECFQLLSTRSSFKLWWWIFLAQNSSGKIRSSVTRVLMESFRSKWSKCS